MQRNAMLMFTSCGWFFDDIGGIESRQILRYAGRALDLARLAGCGEQADRAEREFVGTLATAPGGGSNGDAIYLEERDRCRTDLQSAVAHVALGAAADGGRGRALVPGAAFEATIDSRSVDERGAEAVEGTIDIELCPGLEQGRYEFVGARAPNGRILAGVQPDQEPGGQNVPGSMLERILEAAKEQDDSAAALLSGRFGAVIEPGPWMRPDALREVPRRSVNAGTATMAAELSTARPAGELRQRRASSGLPGGDPPMSNPALDGPLSWRLVRWTSALRRLAALLIEADPDPMAIRDGAADVRAWTLGPSAPDLAAGHPSKRTARLQPVLGGDIISWRLVERLERDVKALEAGSDNERRLLVRMLASLNAAGILGLHPDTWETQTLWWSYDQSADDSDGLAAQRDRVGRKLGFE
jgi:hypothetical protein